MTDRAEREGPAYPIGSVDKALRLVLLVAGRPGGMRIAEVATALGVAPSTAHRLLQMLALHGFARQDPVSKTYHPGEALARLADPRERVRGLARPLLSALVDAHGETVHLGTLDGTSALVLLSVESAHLLRVGDRTGSRQPAHTTAMGRALVSDQDPAEVARALRAAGSDVDEAELADRLAAVRSQGYALQHGEVEEGVSALAVAVDGVSGVKYAIGATFPTGRVAEDRIPRLAESMRASAAELADALRA